MEKSKVQVDCNNPDIANAFFRAGMIESWGRGIEKIIHLCVDEGMAESIFNMAFGGLQIEFIAKQEPISNIMEKSEEKSEGKSEEKNVAFKLLEIIKSNSKATTAVMMRRTGLSKRSVEYQLNILKESGVITRIGSRKQGSWQIDETYASDEKMMEKIEEMSEETTKVSEEMSVEKSKVSVEKGKVSVQILDLLSSKPEITILELSENLGVSTRTVERNLRNLQKSNKIEHIGPNKGGYWKVKTKRNYTDVDEVIAALVEEPQLLYDALKKIIDSKKK